MTRQPTTDQTTGAKRSGASSISNDQIEEIRGRAEAATPGPWLACETVKPVKGYGTELVGYEILGLHDAVVHSETTGFFELADAEFAAHARTDIPALLSALQEAREEIQRLDKAWAWWRSAADTERDRAEAALARVGVLEDALANVKRATDALNRAGAKLAPPQDNPSWKRLVVDLNEAWAAARQALQPTSECLGSHLAKDGLPPGDMPPSEPLAPSAEGWIEWAGGECPVENTARVDVRWSDGVVMQRKAAWLWRWEHTDSDPNIIAYRIAPPKPGDAGGGE